jgi:hypothetical protein
MTPASYTIVDKITKMDWDCERDSEHERDGDKMKHCPRVASCCTMGGAEMSGPYGGSV